MEDDIKNWIIKDVVARLTTLSLRHMVVVFHMDAQRIIHFVNEGFCAGQGEGHKSNCLSYLILFLLNNFIVFYNIFLLLILIK